MEQGRRTAGRIRWGSIECLPRLNVDSVPRSWYNYTGYIQSPFYCILSKIPCENRTWLFVRDAVGESTEIGGD
jgi:hypothetical protein